MRYKEKSHFFTHVILWSSVLFLTCALIWANYAKLDEVTTGQGKVIPSSQIQIIQNLEGGIVSKLLVREGQVVERNQILMQIDNTRFKASYNESRQKIAALKIAIIRLSAEMNNKPMIIPSELTKQNTELADAEKALYESRKQELSQLNSAIQLAQKELDLSKPLVDKGAVSPVEILRLQRSVDELKGKIYQFKSQALEQLNKARAELGALQESQEADKDRLQRTTVRSPLKGIVKRIKVNTIGGVIQPGMDIIEIVPLDDTLLIEAKIRPSDIGFIHLGQKAIVKLTAYEFPIYGGLNGKVEQISADTITDEKTASGKEETYYLIRVRTDKNYLGTEAKPLHIIPGMMATVDILTGSKTVMQYLLKPILKASQAALRER
jgi:adhesin transport system membrane fusion protein